METMYNKQIDKYKPIHLLIGVLVFGSAWGFLEATLGGFLHVILFPNKGAIMAGIGRGLAAVLWVTVGGFAALSIAALIAILAASVVVPVAVAKSLQIAARSNLKKMSYDLMRRQLDVCEEMIREKRVYGVVILGQCMMDLDWESNKALYDWLDERGDAAIGS